MSFYYNPETLSYAHQMLIDRKNNEIKKEELGKQINTLRELYAFQQTIRQESDPVSKMLAAQNKEKINDILRNAISNDIDISATLLNFIQMANSNEIIEYLINMRDHITISNDNIAE